MSEEAYSVEEKESNHPGVGLQEIGNGQPQRSAIDRLFEKMQQVQSEKTNSVGESDECAPATVPTEPSVINRLFAKVTQTRLEALPAAAEKQPVTRITHTEITAMKAATTTAESKPDVVVRKQCASSVNNFWSDLTYFLSGLSALKSKCPEKDSRAYRK